MTSALLRLPQKIPLAEKRRRVEAILEELVSRHNSSVLVCFVLFFLLKFGLPSSPGSAILYPDHL
jgi:hypothetical protein